MSLIPLLSSLALSGYGDPTDGVPSYIEREIHLWTNAVRVDPEYFRDDYVDGGCTFDSFNVVEQTPQIPYWWHGGLGEVARRHSVDMRTNDHFSHSSSDGTSMGNRLAPFYPTGAVGENIAQGYPSAFSVVVQGWMCSTSGHRAAIMSPSFEDLGVGVDADWYTQNFGERGYDPHAFSARLGLHFPERPSSEVTFRLAVHTGDAPPAAVSVVYNGVRHSMGLLIGEPSNGIYEVTVPDDAHGCGAYWFSLDEGGAAPDEYPQDGAYGWGDCPWSDPDAAWMLREDVPALQTADLGYDGDDAGCGCNSAHGGTGWFALLGLLAIRSRR